jgi:hypothetical protein
VKISLAWADIIHILTQHDMPVKTYEPKPTDAQAPILSLTNQQTML